MNEAVREGAAGASSHSVPSEDGTTGIITLPVKVKEWVYECNQDR